MSKLWPPRFGASHSERPLWSELAQLRNYVPIERRMLCHYRAFKTCTVYLVRSRNKFDKFDKVYEPNDPRKAPQSLRGSLKATPDATSFVSPFAHASTKPSAAAEGDIIKKSYRSLLLRIAVQSSHGLGGWVIVPDALRSTDWESTSIEARKRSLLALTLDYTRQIHAKLDRSIAKDRDTDLAVLKQVFSAERLRKLELRGFDAEDVASWGWILAGETADIAIGRLHTISSLATRADGISSINDIPYFMFTIILRSRQLHGSSLALLVSVLLLRLPKEKSTISRLPDATTAMIILVRLMRHARRVAPSQLPAIADLSEILLKVELTTNSSSATLKRLCRNYNRLLACFSIPASQQPFRSTFIQQHAQLKIVRQMASMEPALPVTREGYQALVKVQLAHKKTGGEQDWARTKADSWPPWRQDKLGISEDVDYPGSQSRAADVLQRQIEAGYMQTSWDKAAKILAGWDTDKSPTIQTRTLLPKAPLTWLQSLVRSLASSGRDEKTEIHEDPEVWAARIRATRTVREAWACFCAYDAAWSPGGRTYQPYHALFEKLARRLQPTDPGIGQLPGDGREVFPEPTSPRDHLYVPVEPPSFHAFFDKMQLDGIKPAGRLLALLLDQARTLREGIKYIDASRQSEIKRDVMLNAHKYDAEVIRSTLFHVQTVVVASYLSMLWRTRRKVAKSWYRPTSYAVGNQPGGSKHVDARPVSTRTYVFALLNTANFSVHVCNKLLETVVQEMRGKTERLTLRYGWRTIQAVLGCMDASGAGPDMTTFYTVSSAIEYLIETRPSFKFERLRPTDQQEQRSINQYSSGHQLAKSLFVRAVVGSTQKPAFLEAVASNNPKWLPMYRSVIVEVPSPAALHLLMRILTKTGDMKSILTLLQWMDAFGGQLEATRRQLANGYQQMRFALCVAAIALEEKGTSESVHIAHKLIDRNASWGGWPEDEELSRYLRQSNPSSLPKE